MSRFRAHRPNVLGAWIVGSIELLVAAIAFTYFLRSARDPDSGGVLVIGIIASVAGVIAVRVAARITPELTIDADGLSLGTRLVPWRNVHCAKIVRMGTTLAVLDSSGSKLAMLSAGDWPEAALREIIDRVLAGSSPPPLPWEDAQGGDLVRVNESRVMIRRGGQVQEIAMDEIASLQMAKVRESQSRIVFRLGLMKTDGSMVYPALSRTDEVVLLQVLRFARGA